MASRRLTTEQGLLLQRHFDGDLSAAESVEAEQLVERERAARIYLRALEELRAAVEVADEHAWDKAKEAAPTPDELVELAAEADDLCEAPLDDLAPLLERFFDGEADHAEMVVVRALVDERDDVARYLANLEGLNQGLKAAEEALTEHVDFGAMWRGIEEGIDGRDGDHGAAHEDDSAEFDPDEHLELVHRYHDGQADADQAALIERWLADDDAPVADYLEALDGVSRGVSAANEEALDGAPIDQIAPAVMEAIDSEESSEGGTVVSLDESRKERADKTSSTSSGSESGPGFWRDYRQAVVGGVAAAVVLVAVAALFQDQLFGPEERVVVEERVVFVDDVESSPDSTVRIDGPTEQAGMNDDVPDEANGAKKEDSTVIWLMDSEDKDGAKDEGPRGRHRVAPGEDDEADAGTEDESDAGSLPQGQPI